MEDFTKEIMHSNGQYMILTNPPDDPSVWKLQIYKKILFFKKRIALYWFNNKDQAIEFADKLLKKKT